MEKTIEEWFLKLPEDVRAKATANCNHWTLNHKATSVDDAISKGFLWEVTPEGHGYWNEIYQTYCQP